MPYCSENVCLELHPDYNLYAIGSRSHVSLIDGRLTNEFINYIRSRDPDSGKIYLDTVYTVTVIFVYSIQ